VKNDFVFLKIELRRIFVFCIFLMAVSIKCVDVSAEGLANVWGGFQFSGQHSVTVGSASATTTVNSGFSFGGDFDLLVVDMAEIGIGYQWQFSRSQTLYLGNFNFSDWYFSIRLPISFNQITIYPVGRVGYGLFFGDVAYTGDGSLTGGLYYAVGAGLRSHDFTDLFVKWARDYFFIEGTYDCNSGADYNWYYDFTANVIYSAFNVNIGLGSKF